MNPNAIRSVAALACVLCALGACSSPGSAPEPGSPPPGSGPGDGAGDGIRRDPVVAGRRARVFIMAGFGETCESLPAPTIMVVQPPAKGSVSFEPGQETTINTSASGTCIGQRVLGTGIYYTARLGETGSDTFTIEAELGGSTTRRTFSVEIVD